MKFVCGSSNVVGIICPPVGIGFRECVRNLDLRVQVHPGELWVSKQWVHIMAVRVVEFSREGYKIRKVFG